MKEEIQKLIAAGKIKEALEKLGMSNTDIIMLKSRYNQLMSNKRIGIISSAEAGIELNKITYSILDLLDSLDLEPAKTPTSSFTPAQKPQNSSGMKTVFFSYAHEDKTLQRELRKHFASLRRSGQIADWTDDEILHGKEWDQEISDKIKKADIILLLISNDFIDSDYIWEKELKVAMERHEQNDASVIPVIVRPCDWHKMPFGKLQALPEGGKAITEWGNRDQGYLSVVRGVKKVVEN